MSYIAITAENHMKLLKVRRELRRKGYAAYVPAIVHRRPFLKGRKVKYRRHITKLIPYILAETPEHEAMRDLWLHEVKSIKDVRGYVTINGKPALIADRDIADLKASVSDMLSEIEKSRHKRWLRTGSKASIKSGTLAGKTGTIQWIKRKRVGLEARLFGSMRVVEVEIERLEAA
jgi:transcription antitermination factor NusG